METGDIAAVRALELRAGERFRSVADPRIARCADADPFTADELSSFITHGTAWVAVDGEVVDGEVVDGEVVDGEVVVGFAVADVVDGCAHVEEIAVVPEHGRHGHGTALVDMIEDWARAHGLAALTLTTFRDVPWNRPWYERLGFRSLGDDELTPGLRRLYEAEDARGLPAELRVVMRRAVV